MDKYMRKAQTNIRRRNSAAKLIPSCVRFALYTLFAVSVACVHTQRVVVRFLSREKRRRHYGSLICKIWIAHSRARSRAVSILTLLFRVKHLLIHMPRIHLLRLVKKQRYCTHSNSSTTRRSDWERTARWLFYATPSRCPLCLFDFLSTCSKMGKTCIGSYYRLIFAHYYSLCSFYASSTRKIYTERLSYYFEIIFGNLTPHPHSDSLPFSTFTLTFFLNRWLIRLHWRGSYSLELHDDRSSV